tara:strand:- start:3124 stop:3354 length:231 start_codon:yes stop_codon:yes gene_type:complete
MTSKNRARNKSKKSKKEKLICYCNKIPLRVVEEAIDNGASSLGDLFDRTQAGCGPCGGSCQPELRKLLAKKLKPKS